MMEKRRRKWGEEESISTNPVSKGHTFRVQLPSQFERMLIQADAATIIQ